MQDEHPGLRNSEANPQRNGKRIDATKLRRVLAWNLVISIANRGLADACACCPDGDGATCPMVAGEAFFLRRPTFVLGEQKYMLKTGADYKINKRLSFGLFYRFQTEYYANNPWNVHIFTSKLSYRL